MNIQTRFQRKNNFDLHIESINRFFITSGEEKIPCGRFLLPVLDIFAAPQTFDEAIRKLKGRIQNLDDFEEITRIFKKLVEAGVLLDSEKGEPVFRKKPQGFDASTVHVRMLKDWKRTERYINAIEKTVKPGDVVVEIGTGTGILSLAAARAGAKKVYAIEETSVGKTARALFAENGYSNVITLLEGRSTSIELPEKADVLISEIIGNQPFAEGVLETTRDAIKRFLKKESRLIPSSMSIHAQPVLIPETFLGEKQFTRPLVQELQSRYGFSFASLEAVSSGKERQFMVNPVKTKEWEFPLKSQKLLEVDLSSHHANRIAGTRTLLLKNQTGQINGTLCCFELQLASGISLSMLPEHVEKCNHWAVPLYYHGADINLNDLKSLTIAFHHEIPHAKDGIAISFEKHENN